MEYDPFYGKYGMVETSPRFLDRARRPSISERIIG
jgi:hypothetical protein